MSGLWNNYGGWVNWPVDSDQFWARVEREQEWEAEPDYDTLIAREDSGYLGSEVV